MNPAQQLHALGQSLWLDNITRALLTSGTLRHYIREQSVTGLTSNPTIFNHAIKTSNDYDDAIRLRRSAGTSAEGVLFDLMLDDLGAAADLFRPIYDASSGVDGWVSLEVSPLLVDDANKTLQQTVQLRARANRPNVLIKIPGTQAGVAAIEAAVFAGVPVNVTLLFSREHYVAAAEAYLRGIERRLVAGLDPIVRSVASVFISRWDKAVIGKVPDQLRGHLGIAVAKRVYKAYRDLLASARWQQLASAGAQPQRLLWASTGTKDPRAADTSYVTALAAPDTINTMPEETLLAFADHGKLSGVLPVDGGDAETALVEFSRRGVDVNALSAELQSEGAQSFIKSWNDLIDCIASKSGT